MVDYLPGLIQQYRSLCRCWLEKVPGPLEPEILLPCWIRPGDPIYTGIKISSSCTINRVLCVSRILWNLTHGKWRTHISHKNALPSCILHQDNSDNDIKCSEVFRQTCSKSRMTSITIYTYLYSSMVTHNVLKAWWPINDINFTSTPFQIIACMYTMAVD